ncbi:hypothetical protein [Senegalia massiliensis]|uniref:Uncharacterized protein n=1 Tax=Senegalia massiliensis TaxID=1720316 RepID=A0A845QW87_9CLOT|nr:hypothetical protein [Senegalia massiliensis]NBI06350.1 hypothetical protein [Senegalia massiliensis]
MNPNKKKTYTIIALIVVGVMILSPILYMITTAFSTSNTPVTQDENPDIKDEVTNKTALKIIDMHENLDQYKDKEVSMELQFFLTGEEDKFSLGVIDSFNGEEMLFNILAETKDHKIPEGFKNYDKVKVNGTIKELKETHEDHNHNVPLMMVKNIEKIEQEKKDN